MHFINEIVNLDLYKNSESFLLFKNTKKKNHIEKIIYLQKLVFWAF